MVTRISRQELQAKLDRADSFVLLEALPPMYFEDAHLPGALNLPHDEVERGVGVDPGGVVVDLEPVVATCEHHHQTGAAVRGGRPGTWPAGRR